MEKEGGKGRATDEGREGRREGSRSEGDIFSPPFSSLLFFPFELCAPAAAAATVQAARRNSLQVGHAHFHR